MPLRTHKSMLLPQAIAENIKFKTVGRTETSDAPSHQTQIGLTATATYYDTAIMIDTFVVLARFKLIVSSLFVHCYCQ